MIAISVNDPAETCGAVDPNDEYQGRANEQPRFGKATDRSS
jgi:hypothetical protein